MQTDQLSFPVSSHIYPLLAVPSQLILQIFGFQLQFGSLFYLLLPFCAQLLLLLLHPCDLRFPLAHLTFNFLMKHTHTHTKKNYFERTSHNILSADSNPTYSSLVCSPRSSIYQSSILVTTSDSAWPNTRMFTWKRSGSILNLPLSLSFLLNRIHSQSTRLFQCFFFLVCLKKRQSPSLGINVTVKQNMSTS